MAVFVFGMIRVYLYKENESFIMSLIPGMFYVFITYTYILNAKIGFNLNYNLSNILGIVLDLVFGYFIINKSKNYEERLE